MKAAIARLQGGLSVVLLLLALVPAVVHSEDLVLLPAPAASDPASRQLLDIAQAGDRIVAVGAAGLIIFSDDNGGSWQQAEVPVSTTLTAVDFPVPERGWAVGHAGVILHSTDAGASWELQFDGVRGNAAFAAYAQAQRAAAEERLSAFDAQGEGEGEGETRRAAREDLEYALDDALFIEEEAQIAVEAGPADPFLAVRFFDEHRGLAVGAYGMSFRTDDAGKTWLINQRGIDNPDRLHLYGLYIAGNAQVFMAGEAGLLYHSRDAGLSFERIYDLYDGSLFGVLPMGDGTLAFGLRGHVFKHDGGREGQEGQEGQEDQEGQESHESQELQERWEEVATDNQNSLYGGAALRDGGVLLVGAGGTLLRLGVDGSSVIYRHPSRATFSGALEAPDGTIWLAGMDGLGRLVEAVAQ